MANRGTFSTEKKDIEEHKTRKVPFKEMITNKSIWIVMLCDFANNWGILVMINEGPNFIDKVLNRDISDVSINF